MFRRTYHTQLVWLKATFWLWKCPSSEPRQKHSMSFHGKHLTFIHNCDDHHNGDGCTAISRNSFHLSTYDRLMLNSFWGSCLAQLRSHRSSCVDYKMIEKVICAFYLSQVSCKHMTIHVIRPITDLDLESWNSFGLWLLSGPAMESCLASNMIKLHTIKPRSKRSLRI